RCARCMICCICVLRREFELAEKRRWSPRARYIVVDPELKRTVALANVAATRESPLYQHVQKIVERVVNLLPRISGVGRSRRETPESYVKELRRALDLIPAQSAKVLTAFSFTE